MSDWNPVSVEQQILVTANDIARGVSVASEAYQAFLDAERAYKKVYARAYMGHKGAQTEKKIAANIVPEVEAAELARDVADVAYRFAKDTNAALNSKLEAFRSVGVSVRQAYAVAGRGEQNW